MIIELTTQVVMLFSVLRPLGCKRPTSVGRHSFTLKNQALVAELNFWHTNQSN